MKFGASTGIAATCRNAWGMAGRSPKSEALFAGDVYVVPGFGRRRRTAHAGLRQGRRTLDFCVLAWQGARISARSARASCMTRR